MNSYMVGVCVLKVLFEIMHSGKHYFGHSFTTLTILHQMLIKCSPGVSFSSCQLDDILPSRPSSLGRKYPITWCMTKAGTDS